jgi:flagellar motility protein MotE (MotC chaperone)
MTIEFPRPRLLPATIAAMALLLSLKSIGLARAALSGEGQAPVVNAAPLPQMVAAKASMPASGVLSPSAPPVAAAPEEAPVTDAERKLLLDLRHRRAALDTRARELDQRDAVMAAAEQKLSARVVELTALQARLESLEAAREKHDSANWAGLVRVYETMKPRDAATIFDALDMQVLLGVLDRMAERKAAPILAAMQPDRARLATQLLVEMRTRAVTPPGDKPASIESDKPAPDASATPPAPAAAPKG